MNQIKVPGNVISAAYGEDFSVALSKCLICFMRGMDGRHLRFFRTKSKTMIEVKK
jgi:hypothetical protein